MSIKKKILEKCLGFIKKKKLPKQLAVILLVVSLLAIYFIEFNYKLYKKVCFRKKVILSTVLVTLLAFISITYFFYPNMQSKKVLAGTVSQTEVVEEITREGSVEGTSELMSNIQTQVLTNETTVASPNTSIEGMNPYFIRVNRQQNTVTVYTYDDSGEYTVPIKAMICSTGGENTPLGQFKISQKYEFQKLLFDVYGQYAVRITGQILFHSTSYSESEKDTLIPTEYNSLGEGVSHGCIRLVVADAKWIYDNCDSGTKVEVYDDANPGPLGKPDSITVPEDTKWDPTDPDPSNPWNACAPRFEGVTDQTVEVGTRVNVLEGIKAYDTCGNDITTQITVNGAVNTQEEGTYTVEYKVTDLLGRTVLTTATYKVIEEK